MSSDKIKMFYLFPCLTNTFVYRKGGGWTEGYRAETQQTKQDFVCPTPYQILAVMHILVFANWKEEM